MSEFSQQGLDCAVFITTPEVLGQHKQQLVTTEQLIARAMADGHFRMVEMNERVATNLQRTSPRSKNPKERPMRADNTHHLVTAAVDAPSRPASELRPRLSRCSMTTGR